MRTRHNLSTALDLPVAAGRSAGARAALTNALCADRALLALSSLDCIGVHQSLTTKKVEAAP